MADWRALATGIRQGQAIGQNMRARQGRGLYGEVMTGQPTTYGGAIPLPGQEGQTQDASYEGPALQGDLDKLAEAFRQGGIDEEQFTTAIQNVGMRSYNNINRAWEDFKNAPDAKTKQRAAQEIMYSIPGGGRAYVVAMDDGRFATVPHDEDGNPIEEDGVVLDDEQINNMVLEAVQDPDRWMQLVGMSTMEKAQLEKVQAETKGLKGREERAEDIHPLEKDLKRSQIAKNNAYATGTGGAASSDDNEWDWRANKAIQEWYKAEIDALETEMGHSITNLKEAPAIFKQRKGELDQRFEAMQREVAAGKTPPEIFAAGAGRARGSSIQKGLPAPEGAVKNDDGTVSDKDGNVVGRWK